MLIVFGAGLVGVLVEAFVTRAQRFISQVVVTVVGLAAALVSVILLGVDGKSVSTASGTVVIDPPALFLQGTILVLSLLAVLTMAEQTAGDSGALTAQASAVPGSPEEAAAGRLNLVQSEVYPLLLLSVGGMLLFPASGDLLTMFVALEVFSLPLYIMCGLARRRRLLSQEASMKYFLLGSFSSAFFLFGSAMIYGFAGTVKLSGIASAISVQSGDSTAGAVVGRDGLLLLGIGLLAVGLLFKVSAFPFQAWTPDVYQGAPTPVTGFMAACTKVAAFGALLRIAYVAVPDARWDWQPALWVVAVATMLIGSIVAIVQADVKRMLAYSSIAHAGFILAGLISMDKAGVSGVLFYLAAYGFTTIGAFTLVGLVRNATRDGGVGGEATHLSQWAGLGKQSPLLAGLFTLFLLAFAGIPLTSGFTGKYAVFSAALDSAPWGAWLVGFGVLASAIAVFFYVRVLVLMYFSDPEPDVEGTTVVVAPGALTVLAVGIGAVATIVLGVMPTWGLHLAQNASVFLP
ncbi:NADH-quinone oxidoreductase subunit NuoN [Spongisporangium articulatum]|uniref:NADH-quinone oxidoreductase subunit N n=1 Tax=Spongisporangium articulatum TaxID=3362603 RepID=A0ABW8APW5_9ACTN